MNRLLAWLRGARVRETPDRTTSCLLLALLSAAPVVVSAQELTSGPNPATRIEIDYAEALNKVGLPDYAKIVLDRITDPAAKTLVKTLRMQALAAKGDFEQVKAMIAREPDQNSQDVWAMKLTLADTYYAWGRYPEARGIYESLFLAFPKGPSEVLNDFYVESSYKYARMLILLGTIKEAALAYDHVTKAKISRAVRRQVVSEKAELLVKLAKDAEPDARDAYLKQAEEICNEIFWVQDLWFGKAIVILAHVRMIRGDIDGAMSLIEEYGPQLRQIDDILKEDEAGSGEPLTQLSPMAECRYLLGVMMQEEAEKLLAENGSRDAIVKLLAGARKSPNRAERTPGALHHFLNVFIRYPGTSWAPDAGARAERIETILKAPPFNAEIEKKVTPEQLRKVEELQFQSARLTFNQNQFKEAADIYVRVLNLFPEGIASVPALGELARSYVEADSPLYAETTTRYLAERFHHRPTLSDKAAEQILRISMLYAERNQPDLRDETYELYFRFFPKHSGAPATMFRYAEQRFERKDFQGALDYYNRIAENYASSPLRFDALARIVSCHAELRQPAEEIKALQAYIEALEKRDRPGQDLITARYREAVAYKELGPKYLVTAFNRLVQLEQLLTGPNRSRYEPSAAEKEINDGILQGTLYNKAGCYALLPPPKGQPDSYRALQAIRTFEALANDFPKSRLAPSALSQIGTLWTILDRPKEAGASLERLQKEYPDSPEAGNALFMLGMNLLKMDRKQQAVEVFREMFSSTGKYTDRQILTAGRELLPIGELNIALDAFNRVLQTSRERGIREPAMMGKGEALIRQEKFAEAADVLAARVVAFHLSAFTVDASLHLSRAYSEIGMNEADTHRRIETFNRAVDAMNRARKFEQEPSGRAALDLEVARIALRKAQAEDRSGDQDRAATYRDEAIATYQKLILFGNKADGGVRTHVETAYRECIPLLFQTQRWQDVVDDADAYLEEFRGGQYAREIGDLRGQARVQLASAGRLPERSPSNGRNDNTGEKSGTEAP